MGMLARFAAMGGSAAAQTYVDDVFSAYTYTGNGSTQTITTGINLADNGGMVWIKSRSAATDHWLGDTVRPRKLLKTNSAIAAQIEYASPNRGILIGSSGFDVEDAASLGMNNSGATHISWTFRKAAKFFDIVTYTGNGANRTISHSLGQVPGMIVVRRTNSAGSWMVYHRSLANTENLVLDSTAAKATNATAWNSTTATSSVFSIGTHADVNTNNGTYVAYLFAHDTGTDGLIQCGSYTGNGAVTGPTISLGWEPQYILIKNTTSAGVGWVVADSARGIPTGSNDPLLFANSSDPESSVVGNTLDLIATGFKAMANNQSTNENGSTYIYLAIRRPNKPPTSGTQVYNAIARTGTGVAATVTGVGFAPDALITGDRGAGGGNGPVTWDRLRGASQFSWTNATSAEQSYPTSVTSLDVDGISVGTDSGFAVNRNTFTYINWFFRRAPGVFDVVCYTGTTSSGLNISHSLGVVPEMFIVKCRSAAGLSWGVYHKDVGNDRALFVNQTAAQSASSSAYWNSTTPTASVFTLGNNTVGNAAQNYVAYLFATKAGISKVGSYTGNGSSQTINCGFTTGARFVLIKRKDSTGDWFVWDTARGIIAGSDPHLSLNTETAEVTTDDSIDPDSSGFVVNQVAAPNINVNGAVYIFLAYA